MDSQAARGCDTVGRNAMKTFPIGLVVEDRRCLVIGGDREAFDKTRRLLAAGARVTIVAPMIVAALEVVVRGSAGRASWCERHFVDADLDPRPALVMCAVRDEALCARLHARADADGFLLCTVDQPQWCTFTNLAVAEVGEVVVALGSGGSAPGLLRRLRDDLVAGLGGSFPSFTRYVSDVRAKATPEGRRDALAEAISGLRLEITVHLPSHWRERWKALSPAGYESGVHALPPLHDDQDLG
jgi:precorrin-2 dehydrogenase / sirohydrochlorin ferrochelatase